MSRRPRHILRISSVNKCIRDLPAVLHVLQDNRNRDAWLFQLSRPLWPMCYYWCLNEKSGFTEGIPVVLRARLRLSYKSDSPGIVGSY